MSLAEDVRELRNTLFDVGWCQNGYYNEAGERCLKGASFLSTMEAREFLPVWKLMDGVAAQEGFLDTIDFNDAPGRTFDQIVEFTEKCEKAAEALEASNVEIRGLSTLD